MVTVRLKHHDDPEALRRQIEKRFKGTVDILKINGNIAEIKFDETEAPWKHHRTVGDAISDLMEENEEIFDEEVIA